MVGDSANNASTRDSARSVGVFATFISPSESICADPSESTSVSLAVSVTTAFFAYLFRLPAVSYTHLTLPTIYSV